MAIKFPQNIEEYTNGELWNTGVDESVARRILFSLNKVEDPREMRLRKIYLAHFYCEREDYRLATNLCRQILLEGGIDKEVLLLMQYCCLKHGDIMGVGEVFGFVKEMSEEDRTSFMENFDAEEIPPSMLVDTSQRKKGTKVEYKDGWVEYYDKSKLIYKFFDNDYFAFMKDNSARRMLGAGDPIGAVAQLDAVKFDHVRHSTILLCKQTYVNAFLELGEHLNAFSHCKVFIDKNMYIDAMLPLLDGLRKDGCDSQFEELRRFIGSLKGYEINQLTSFFDYSDETGDYTFWEMLEESNPLEELPESDERLCLQGRACDRNGDFESAEKYWRKAIALYGQFSSANYYLNYPEILSQVEDKDEIETSDLMDNFKEVFIKDMGNWKNKDDLRDNVDKKATQLNIALCDLYIDLDRLSSSVRRIYKSGYLPLVSEIDRLAVCEDVEDVNKSICLANFLMYRDSKTILWRGEKRRNIVAEMDGDNEEIKYGIAIFAAHVMIRLTADAEGLKKIYSELKKFYSMLHMQKVGQPKAYVVYAFLLEYYAGMPLPSKRMPNYLKDIDELRDAFIGSVEILQSQDFVELRDKMLSKLYAIKKRI